MSDFFKKGIKSVLEKKNLFVILQIVWIIEFYILAIFSAKDLLCFVTKEKIKEPQVIETYSRMIVNWLDTYNEYILIMGIILFFVGLSGAFFKLIPILNKYTIIYTYSDFGLYAGWWLLVIYGTYVVFMSMGKAFLIAPVIAYVLYLLIKKMNEWLESKGITFGG